MCLGASDFLLPGPATVQLLASSSGTLRIWADGALVHRRSAARPFQPDSDRASVSLGEGVHPPDRGGRGRPAPADLHLRFRREGSSLEHERLIQLALTRPGDPVRSRKILEDVEKSQCLKCHRVATPASGSAPS